MSRTLQDRDRIAVSSAKPGTGIVEARGSKNGSFRLFRLFRRREPTTFHRCLAVHMHFAERSSALN